MKKVTLIISVIAACIFASSCNQTQGQQAAATSEEATSEVAAKKGEIVFVDLDRIFEEYDMANDLRSVVETKAQGITNDVNRRRTKLENEAKAFQEKIDKGLMTRSTAEVQAQKLAGQEQEFNNYAAQKQNEILEEQQVMMNQIADAIKSYLDKYNKEKGYAMILTNQGDVPVITANEALNITDAVLAGLNEEYIKSKNSKKE